MPLLGVYPVHPSAAADACQCIQGGRVAITSTTAATDEAGFTLFSDAAVTAVNVSAYHVDPIWVSPAEVKTTPRVAPRVVAA